MSLLDTAARWNGCVISCWISRVCTWCLRPGTGGRAVIG